MTKLLKTLETKYPSRKRFEAVAVTSVVHHHQPLQLVTLFLLIILATNQTTANLCTLCQSLREHAPNEFHSCLLRNLEIRHCEEGVDTHLTSLKIVGVRRTVKVNYEQEGVIWWEVWVSVVQDGGGGGDET